MSELIFNLKEKIATYEKWREESRLQAKEDYTHIHDDTCYDRWIRYAKSDAVVGNFYAVDVAAPGTGHIVYKITEVCENGNVLGDYVSDNVRELTIEDVI